MMDVYLKNMSDLVSTCLLLHNIWIIFRNNIWKIEWLQKVTHKVHDALALKTAVGTTGQEKLAVVNHALHTLAGIDDIARETLEYLKQECTREFEIAMSTGGKSTKELCTRRNGIASSLWMTNTKACVTQTFPINSD
jgi:hypothetical protein